MILGFTGTRGRLTPAQRVALVRELRGLHLTGVFNELRHGDCVGADEFVHYVALALGWRVVVHPPSDEHHRAFCEGAWHVLAPDRYLARNRAIVSVADRLLAAPDSATERTRSGTWSTVRRARRVGVPVVLVDPDGTRRFEGV